MREGADESADQLRNQFNFSERASQTLNNGLRERGTMTEPPPSVEYSAQSTQWEIFDGYIEDMERKKEAERKAKRKKDDPAEPEVLRGRGARPGREGKDLGRARVGKDDPAEPEVLRGRGGRPGREGPGQGKEGREGPA